MRRYCTNTLSKPSSQSLHRLGSPANRISNHRGIGLSHNVFHCADNLGVFPKRPKQATTHLDEKEPDNDLPCPTLMTIRS